MVTAKKIGALSVTAALAASAAGSILGVPLASAENERGNGVNAKGDGTGGTITINKTTPENVTPVVYDSYKIFNADISTGSLRNVDPETGQDGDIAALVSTSDIHWTSDLARTTVINAIKSYDSSYEDPTDADASAQKAAEYIGGQFKVLDNGRDTGNLEGQHIRAGEHASAGQTAGASDDSFAFILAKAVKASLPKGNSITEGQTSGTFDDGWYLFTSNDVSNNQKDNVAASAPIFAAVGGDPVVVTSKSAYPTLEKFIKNDSNANADYNAADASWGKVADSSASQDIRYRLDSTISSEIDTYDTYTYKFHDILSGGVRVKDADDPAKLAQNVKVVIYKNQAAADADPDGNGTDTANAVTVTPDSITVNQSQDGKDGSIITGDTEYATNALKGEVSILHVNFNDLKNTAHVAGQDLTKDSIVRVTYQAHLDSGTSLIASTGNPNVAYLEYSNNPQGTGTGYSTQSEVHDFTYAIKINKTDKANGADLKGAQFSVKSDDGKYVNNLGEEVDDEYVFTTDDKGEFYVPRVDAATYTIHEIAAPGNYQTTSDFTITITPTYDEDQQTITKIASTHTQSHPSMSADDQTAPIGHENDENVAIGIHDGDGFLDTTDATNYDASLANGEVDLTVSDVKNVPLPITGMQGYTTIAIVGGLIIAASVVARKRSNRKNANEVQMNI